MSTLAPKFVLINDDPEVSVGPNVAASDQTPLAGSRSWIQITPWIRSALVE
ncbi:MAG: hypothetical protein AAGI22_28895 [Planctomycetota bacterium]